MYNTRKEIEMTETNAAIDITAEPTETSLLGPLPLVIQFAVTPEGAAAIQEDQAKPNRVTLPTPSFRVTISWLGITAHRLGTNEFGEPSWNGGDRYDDVAAVMMSGLMLTKQNVITIGLRRLAELVASNNLCGCDVKPTQNGGRIIDLGTI